MPAVFLGALDCLRKQLTVATNTDTSNDPANPYSVADCLHKCQSVLWGSIDLSVECFKSGLVPQKPKQQGKKL